MTRRPASPSVALLLAPLLLATAAVPSQAQATVWHVAADGSGDAPSLQAAVDAAAEGDVIVAGVGAHQPFVVAGKSLAIFGTNNAAIFQTVVGAEPAGPTITIRDLAAHQWVVLDGFTVFNSLAGPEADLAVVDCAGTVWLQDLFLDSYGAPALLVAASDSVVFTDSQAQTNLMPTTPAGDPQPGPGLRAQAGARLFGHGSSARGSHGNFLLQGATPPNAPASGGPGAWLVDARARFTDCSLLGGNGSAFVEGGCTVGGAGGPGLLVQDPPGGGPAAAVLLESTATGAAGGFFDPGCAPPPTPGADVELQGGTLGEQPGVARRLGAPGVAPVGSALALTFEGEPGDVAWLFASTRGVPALEAGALVIHLDPQALLFLFALPLPSGVGTVSVPVVPLPPGLEALVAPLQALFVDAQGAQHVSGPRAVLVL